MKDFFLNLMSSSTVASSKRFLLILFGIVLAGLCIYIVIMGEYVLPVTTLGGLITLLAEMNRRENKAKIECEKLKEE